MNWTKDYFHDESGKIFGEVPTTFYELTKFKALYDNSFLGWYVSKEQARKAVENRHKEIISNVSK